jgi:hypothetical protein
MKTDQKTKKPKVKTKTSKERAKLNAIAARVRRMLRRDTINIVEVGKLLLKSRALLADEHGQWKPWLSKNFDLSYFTARNYCLAAEYVVSKSLTVQLFRNLAPSVLYWLAEGRRYSQEQEDEILAQAKAGRRIDQDAEGEIRERLAPPPTANEADDAGDDAAQDGDDAADDAHDDDAKDEDDADADREIGALLDGPPPVLPESEPATPCNFALRDFDLAVAKLKTIMTKPAAQFTGTVHSGNDLLHIETFIRDVATAKRFAGLETGELKPVA